MDQCREDGKIPHDDLVLKKFIYAIDSDVLDLAAAREEAAQIGGVQ